MNHFSDKDEFENIIKALVTDHVIRKKFTGNAIISFCI